MNEILMVGIAIVALPVGLAGYLIGYANGYSRGFKDGALTAAGACQAVIDELDAEIEA